MFKLRLLRAKRKKATLASTSIFQFSSTAIADEAIMYRLTRHAEQTHRDFQVATEKPCNEMDGGW